MSKFIIPNLIECEVEFDQDPTAKTSEQKTRDILNSLLDIIPTLDLLQWQDVFENMGMGVSLAAKDGKRAYKVAAIEILMNLASRNGWLLAKDGNKVYVYDEQYWIEISTEMIKKFLQLASNKLGIPKYIASDAGFIEDIYKQLLCAGFFEKMESKNTTLLNLENGTLHIDQDGIELKDFNPNDFLTYQLDFKYDTDSVNSKWLEFLNNILPDKDTQKTLQQALGYLLTKDLKLEKAIFLYGTGSNGKSVIFEVLHGLLSQEMFTNYSLESLTQASGYHRAGLHNKYINYGTDISMKKIEHGVFKQLVSGEPLEVRQIYQAPFIMKNYAKLIVKRTAKMSR